MVHSDLGFDSIIFCKTRDNPPSAQNCRSYANIHEQAFASGPRHWSQEEFEDFSKMNGVLWTEAYQRNALVGFSVSRVIADEVEILTLCRDPRVNKKGVGSALMHEMIRSYRAKKLKRALLEVDDKNTGALKLYRKWGFEEISQRPRYFTMRNGDVHDALILSLSIGQVQIVTAHE